MKRLIIVIMLAHLTTPLFALAEDQSTAPRQVGDMTVEERMTMMKIASSYNNCIYSQAISRASDFDDIRHTADFAMGACQDKLTDLEKSIKAMGFDANFALAFSKSVRRRAARKIIPELAIRKSGG